MQRSYALRSLLASSVNGVAASLFAVLFPSDCRLCGLPLTNISRLPVCQACLAGMLPITESVCGVCGERVPSPFSLSMDRSELRCGMCRRAAPFARAAAYGSYEGSLRGLIHLLKYEQVRPTARVLGAYLAQAMNRLDLPPAAPPIVMVPVPLHHRKLRQRGFNQSELVAREALKHVSGLALRPALLDRQRETQSQTGLTRHQRRENMRGAFAVRRPAEIAGREVLLVDDVFTTGTTVSECARILRRGGASRVYVATVARTLRGAAVQAKLPQEVAEEEYTLKAAG